MKTPRSLLPALAAVFLCVPGLHADPFTDLYKESGAADLVDKVGKTVDNAGGYLDSASSSVKGVTTAGRLGAGFAENFANVTADTVVTGLSPLSNLTYGELNQIVSGTFHGALTNGAGQLTIVTSGGAMVLDGFSGVALSAEAATTNSALITGNGFMKGVQYTTYGANMGARYLLAYTDPQLALKEINKLVQDIGSDLEQLTSGGMETMGQLSRPAVAEAVFNVLGVSLTTAFDNSPLNLSQSYEFLLTPKPKDGAKASESATQVTVSLVFQSASLQGKTTEPVIASDGTQKIAKVYTLDDTRCTVKVQFRRKLGTSGVLSAVGTIQGGVRFSRGLTLRSLDGKVSLSAQPPQMDIIGSLVIAGRGTFKTGAPNPAPEEVAIEAQLAKIDVNQQLDLATGQPVAPLTMNASLAVAATAKFGNTRVKLDWAYTYGKDIVLADFSGQAPSGGLAELSDPEVAAVVAGTVNPGSGQVRPVENLDPAASVPANRYAITTNRGTFVEVDANGRLAEGGPYASIADIPPRARFDLSFGSNGGVIAICSAANLPYATGLGASTDWPMKGVYGFMSKSTAHGSYLIDYSGLYASYNSAGPGALVGSAAPVEGVPSENRCLFTLHPLKPGELQPIAAQSKPQGPSRFEIGRVHPVQTDRNTWHSVAFTVPMRDPIVVMGPATRGANDDGPSTVRVRNVTKDGFEYQVQDWSYLDGKWTGGSIGWMAVDRGPFQVRGIRGFAGSIRKLDHRAQSAVLPQPFSTNPVVLAQVVTDNDPTPVCTRIAVTNNYQFSARLQEEEAADGVHGVEEVHFLALAPGSGTLNGAAFSAIVTPATVGHFGLFQPLGASFTHAPAVFGNLNSINDTNPATVGSVLWDAQTVWLWAQEETSLDNEIAHGLEVGGIFVFDLPSAEARVALETDFVHDFETRGLSGWTVEGDAFSEKDITSDLENSQGVRFVQHDTYHLWGYKSGGNDQYGKLISPAFTVPASAQFTFLLAGGNNATRLRASLRRFADDAEVFWATGTNSDIYRRVTWDISAYAGQQLYFAAVDTIGGSGGHLSLDDLRVLEGGTYASTPLGTINHGVARYDKRDGTGYVMYSAENLRTRFAGKWPLAGKTADHLVAIGWDATKKQWYFDNGDKGWYPFTPRATDRLLAVFTAKNDKISDIADLEGQSFSYNGIAVGYDWGNFRFKRNLWNGSQNDGEIDILRPMPTGGYSFLDYQR